MHTVTLRIKDDGIYEQLMQFISGLRQVEIRDAQSKIPFLGSNRLEQNGNDRIRF